MPRSAPGLAVAFILVAAGAAAAEREFNWLPSGRIAVGEPASEAAARYEACGEVQTLTLAYRGETPRPITGRQVSGPERFVIRPASYRGGPAPGHLVIGRCLDTAAGPQALRVRCGDQDLGTWNITPPEGDRRLYDALFIIPRSAWCSPDHVPAEVPVTLTAAEPALVLGYRFHVTRDWDVLGEELAGDLQAAAAKNTAVSSYLKALVRECDHDWQAAWTLYNIRDEPNPQLERLARVAMRRMQLRLARAAAAAQDPAGDQARPDFAAHYRLGLLAAAWGCWEDALAELRLATQAAPTHADATYRLAEAMEYNRLPIGEWAPLFERAGFLGESAALAAGRGPANVEDILIAVHCDAVPDLCGTFSRESLDQLQRDWRYVEQQVYGASRGAWKLRTHLRFWGGPAGPAAESGGGFTEPWVMQAGWIFLPPDSAVPVTGTYDYSIGTAEYGSSHAGGVDCGVAGSGGAQIGPTRGWEVLLHEWNHEFDWVCISGEQVPSFPATHDSDGCGKQPIVSMGCGHRSAMRYYINRAQYLRHEASDPVVSAAFIGRWQLGPVVNAPSAPDPSPEGLADWLVRSGHMNAERIEQLRREWADARKAEQARAARPPLVRSEPPPAPVPDWPGFLQAAWNRIRLLDQLADESEAAIVTGQPAAEAGWRPLAGAGDFVDLRAAVPGARDKCVAYARTFLYVPATQEARLWLGYNDVGAVWLNGRRIHAGRYYACAKWEDQNRPCMVANSGRLAEGWNCLAVKIERGGGDWGFSVHVVDFDNRPIAGLRVSPELPAGETCHRYEPPAAGPYYRWSEVRDDFMELLPRLGSAELARLTGIPGLKLAEHRFLLTLPPGQAPPPGARYLAAAADADRALNNYLNWDAEAAAALRYAKDGELRDLLLVRPEYVEEFLALLRERAASAGGSEAAAGNPPVVARGPRPAAPADRLLGYVYIPECDYATTPNRTGRAVVVIDAALGDYPPDDLDLLAPDASGS